MEHKLFYKNPYMTRFKSEAVSTGKDESGRSYAVLKETAFYPTGGGQPFDTGTLNGVTVTDVEEVDGEIRHYLTAPMAEREVEGEIDWARRFDHMQQHSGQHILSAAFEDLFDSQTVGFHLGSETVTIDLDREELTEEEAEEAEKLSNRIVAENRPIIAKRVSPEEAAQYPLRKELSVAEDIRLVIIPDFDYGGCGGTHPKSTGETGPIKILGWERQRKKIRLEFVCGQRVLAQLHQKQKIIRDLTGILNAPELQLSDAARKLVLGGKTQEKVLEELRGTLLTYEAADLVAENNGHVISRVFQDRTIKELQKLARYVIGEKEEAVVLFVSENGDQLQIVCGKGPKSNGNMKNILMGVLPLIEGKGGGSETFAQGGGRAVMSGQALLGHMHAGVQ
ncbi:alanyl-tRNA editing protein [Mesobacillus zeae]|uniref:alanyl-tRNA editing protein n=1 Tax=Mesobacillus zeae TaxID=1917180 RepID=UPI00300BBD2B